MDKYMQKNIEIISMNNNRLHFEEYMYCFDQSLSGKKLKDVEKFDKV